MSLNQKMGEKIRSARYAVGMTQKDLGQQLGRSGATIAYLEQGKRRISPDVLEQIARATGKPLSYFYEESKGGNAKLEGQLEKLYDQLDHLKTILNYSALEKTGDFSMNLFNQANDLMIVIDMSGKIVAVNQRYEDLMGWKQKEVVGQPFWKFNMVHEDHMPALIKLFEDCVRKQEVVRLLRFTLMTKEGGSMDVESSAGLLREEGKPWALFSIIRPLGTTVVQLEDLVENSL